MNSNEEVTPTNLLKCPFCQEDIDASASKCKHCGEWVSNEERFKARKDVYIKKWQPFFLFTGGGILVGQLLGAPKGFMIGLLAAGIVGVIIYGIGWPKNIS
ncbi:hypothetical protein HUU59_10330 [bacterium]|nr:hypothetical protein [bacterium]